LPERPRCSHSSAGVRWTVKLTPPLPETIIGSLLIFHVGFTEPFKLNLRIRRRFFNFGSFGGLAMRNAVVIGCFLLLFAFDSGHLKAQSTSPSTADASEKSRGPRSLQWDSTVLIREFQLAAGHPKVSTELGLLPYQIEQLKQNQYELQTGISEVVREYARGNAEQRTKKLQELYDQADIAIERVLLPKQRQRLQQLAIQSLSGTQSNSIDALLSLLNNPLIRQRASLSEEDVKKVVELARNEQEKFQQTIQELREQAHRAILAELPRESRQQLEALLGTPFDFGPYELGNNGVFRKVDEK
jgi:hypothetical protein